MAARCPLKQGFYQMGRRPRVGSEPSTALRGYAGLYPSLNAALRHVWQTVIVESHDRGGTI